MKTVSLLLIQALMIIGKLNANEIIPELNIYMEEWAPFQYKDEKNPKQGFAVDLLDLVLKDAKSDNSKKDFLFIPWARAMTNLKNTIDSHLQRRKGLVSYFGIDVPGLRVGLYMFAPSRC